MIIPVATYLNGISAIICMIFGLSYGIYFFYLYSKMRKSLMPWIAVTAIGGGFLYFGPVSSFISLLLTGNNISPTLYGLFSYTSPSIATFTGMYAGFSIFNPKRKKIVALIYAITGIVFLLSLYLFPTYMITAT